MGDVVNFSRKERTVVDSIVAASKDLKQFQRAQAQSLATGFPSCPTASPLLTVLALSTARPISGAVSSSVPPLVRTTTVARA